MPNPSPPPSAPAGAAAPGHLVFPVVGIGGSAGAFPALLQLFGGLPERAGMAFVVVLHLSPDHESDAAGILQRSTQMPVVQVRRRTRLEADHVYVIAPGLDLLTEDGHVQATSRKRPRSPSAAIDIFFRTLADVHQDRAIAIVMSGTGSDGSVGVTRIKEQGGITIAQAPEDAQFSEMPRSAIATDTIDFVLSTREIASRLVELSQRARDSRQAPDSLAPAEDNEPTIVAENALGDILSLLRVHTRNDFRNYKRATVLRRVARRMQIHGLSRLEEYRDLLRERPEETEPLLHDMLISVTNFFRDPAMFERLERLVVPRLFEALKPGEDLRVWVAGCATGEEAYSVGILLREWADKLAESPKVQIFATDLSDAALAVARQGDYPMAIAADVSPSRLAHYFQLDNERYRVTPALRDQVLFAKHNVLTDPAFSRLDLICCRNLLIYLDNVAQKAALESFSYALKPDGILFLGNAESPELGSTAFTAVDQKARIYRVNADALRMARLPSSVAATPLAPAPTSLELRGGGRASDPPLALLHQRALAAVASPSILIDERYDVLHRSERVGQYLAAGTGIPSHNLLDNVAPDLRLELRTALFKAQESAASVTTRVGRSADDGSGEFLDISVHPVRGGPLDPRRWLVVFEETVSESRADKDSGSTDADHRAVIDTLEEENRGLKLHLQDTLDRAAVSAEEFKSTNEELQASNEELRSATEELETSKEELQSMNEELVTVNYELRMKVEESARTNDDLRNLMTSAEMATVFVDGGLRIKRFTPQATKLFHLIASDVGRPLLDIRSRLEYDEMEADAVSAFQELRVVEREIHSTDERRYLVRVLPYRTALNAIEGAVLTFFDVTRLRHAEERARLVEKRLREAVEFSEDFAVLTTDEAGVINTWNAGAEAVFGYPSDEILGRKIDELFTEEDRAAGVPQGERRKARETGRAEDERWHRRKDGSRFYCSGVMTPLRTGEGLGFAKIGRDITEGKRLELERGQQLDSERAAGAKARVASDLKDEFLAVMSHELKQPLNLIQVNAELLTRLPEMQASRVALRIGDTIQRAVGAQTKIVDDLLDLSRIRTGKMSLHREIVDVVEMANTLTAAMASDAQKKRVEIAVSGPETLMCNCDQVRVEQILWNLLGNALKFTPAQGRIRVDVAQEGGFVKLSVADTGAGIPEAFLPHVFDMFRQDQTTSASGAGLGIGLALVDALVQAHGGRVEAASGGVGRGATFTVWLPIESEELPHPPVALAAQKSLPGKRVLVVDDDADSLSSFAMLLEIEGAEVQAATSGEEALAQLRQQPFDLLFSDLGMPKMDGFALISEVRKIAPARELKAIAVTGFGREADVARALQAGFDAHVSKPASMAQIKAVVGRL